MQKLTRVKVGETEYRIKQVNKVTNAKTGKRDETKGGYIFYNEGLIEILESLNEYEKINAIYHELSHAIIFELGKKHNIKEMENEEFVQDMADVLKTIFKIKKLKKNE